jgi:hypothetical protein
LLRTIMIDETILRRVQKCLALSQSPEPHEAAAAMRQAQKLMEMHNISVADIDKTKIGEAEVKSAVSVSKVKDWELALVHTVASAFGCSIMWRASRSWASDVYGRYILVGSTSQVELAQYTCIVMLRKLIKARAEFVRDIGPYSSREYKSKAADSFCKGWIATIRKTVSEFALDDNTKVLIENHIKDRNPEGGKAKVKGRELSTAGYLHGQEAAKGESINRPMNAAAGNLMIGA